MHNWQLVDRAFVGDTSITAGQPNQLVYWDRPKDTLRDDVPTFFTNECIFWEHNVPQAQAYGILFESYGIMPGIFKAASKNHAYLKLKYKHIFTYSDRLLSLDRDLFKFAPAYGIQIGGTHAGGKIEIAPKTKNVSMVASNKNWTPLQQWRVAIADLLNKEYSDVVDTYGASVGRNIKFVEEGLTNYRFSIAVENVALPNYFTEKILNCFAVGTVPIYLGCRNISSFFNPKGIITMPADGNLIGLLKELTPERYEEMGLAIKENFELAKEYRSVEDYIFLKYFTKQRDCPFMARDVISQ